MTITEKSTMSDCIRILLNAGIRYSLDKDIISYIDMCTAQTVVLIFNPEGQLIRKQTRTFFMF